MQREKNLLFIVFAFIFALLAAAGAYYYINSYESKLLAESGIMVPVISTNIELKAGTEIKPFMISTIQWPKKKVISTHILKKDAVIGKITKTVIPKGFPILSNMISTRKTSISSLIPEKMRAMTIQSTANSADATFIKPDVWVDILATFSGGGQPAYTKTILKNVKIIAVNGLTKDVYPTAKVDKVEELTVLVKAKDVEKLAFAKTEARIQVVLRNQNDTDEEIVDENSSPLINDIKKTVQDLVPAMKEYSKPITLIRGTEVKKVHL